MTRSEKALAIARIRWGGVVLIINQDFKEAANG
jgi:hypothetical protein